jgi:hypothetical protein
MAYEGDLLLECPGDVDFSIVYAVIVTGVRLNPCGHALLFVGTSSNAGRYFHVAKWHDLPRQMPNQALYQRYLRENGKREVTRYVVYLPNPDGAAQRLEEVMGKPWQWLVLPHNCAAFVEEIVQAGGSTAGLYSNCPRLERFR